MNADDVIESYVRDVARHLPRARRNDVAFELRALLADELAAKSQAEGRAPDRAMALDLLKGFGRPAEAAARYHPQTPLIDPSDNHNFLIWAIGGSLVVIALNPHDGLAWFTWIGGVFLFFAALGWARRRQPAGRFLWRPTKRPDMRPDRLRRGFALLMLAPTLIFPVFMYLAPQAFVDVAFRGWLPSDALALTEAFRDSWQRAATIAALLALVAVYVALFVQGGWRGWTRWVRTVAHVCLGVLFVVHASPMISLRGETFMIFASPAANAVAMPIFGLVGAITVLSALYEAWREWSRIRPAPALETGRA